MVFFRAHNYLFFLGVIVVTDKMKKAVDNYTVKLISEISTEIQRILLHAVNADEQIAGKDIINTIIESDDVCVVVVFEVTDVYVKNIIV